MQNTLKKKNNGNHQIILNIVFVIMAVAIIFPFLLVLSVSFSDEKEIVESGYSLIPKVFSLEAYKYIFKKPESVFNAYKVTITFSLIYMVLSVFLMACLAYMLSKKDLKGRSAISFYVYFTMLFSGGLVPTYILNTQYLHLGDTIWIYILPTLISPWYTFMIRTFFTDIPAEISESAYVDGASDFTILFRIILPLSKPVIAAVSLFMLLAKWNDWYTAMLYINNTKLISLQYLLQKMMDNISLLNQEGMSSFVDVSNVPTETVRMAMAVIVAGPALIVFPFFQKYFVKGLTVGSVKG